MNHVSRRDFIKTSAAASAAITSGLTASSIRLLADDSVASTQSKTDPPKNAIPRWRGFNLLDYFQAFDSRRSSGVISEDDCRWMRDWGFDFVRLPADYWFWIDSDWRKTGKMTVDDMFQLNENVLQKLDRAIETVNKFGLHLNLNLHRAPGYCVNDPTREPASLWTDSRAEEAFIYHWKTFAKRYRGISNEKLSFNLVNEAPSPREGYMTREDYCRVMTRAAKAIQAITPDRTIFIDGLTYGNIVLDEMIPTGVVQSVHGYSPSQISHYRASWVDRNSSFPTPTWPLLDSKGNVSWDRKKLEEHYRPWDELVRKGIGVHCGEVGCYNKTPYDVFHAWLSDVLDILKGYDIGWSLWEFRGSFGVLDSGRTDIEYEDWHGHKLDRRLLQLLQKS